MKSLRPTPKGYRGSIIRIDEEEMLRLIQGINQHELIKTYPDFKKGKGGQRIKWSSSKESPNYQTLKFIIDAENEGEEKVKYEIETGFLYGLIKFKTAKKVGRKGKYGFYHYNLNALYHFLYRKSREAYFLEMTYRIHNQEILPQQVKIVVYCSSQNISHLKTLQNSLQKISHLDLVIEYWDRPGASLSKVMRKVGENGVLIQFIGQSYFEHENSIRDLTKFLHQTNHRIQYLERSIHIVLPSTLKDELDIGTMLGKITLLSYWDQKIRQINEQIAMLLQHDGAALQPELRRNLEDYKQSYNNIAKNLIATLSTLYDKETTLRFDTLETTPNEVINKIQKKITSHRKKLQDIIKEVKKSVTLVDQLYNAIRIPSENDPLRPEFPPKPFYQPRFPASNCYPINIPGFSNIWLKDESTNPTGTHKDRMAWEVVIKYKEFLKRETFKKVILQSGEVPRLSIISSGSAAIAIQNFLSKFFLPDLKVLIDHTTQSFILEALKKAGCEVYPYDLSQRLLQPDDVKRLTNNLNGLDITYREIIDYNHKTYYDWLSYEILDHAPDFCFVPFGTGDLFQNILNISHDETIKIQMGHGQKDPRLSNASVAHFTKCHFMAATTSNPKSKLTKLYSAFLPSLPAHQHKISRLKETAMCGKYTGIYNVSDYFTDKAIDIAQSLGLSFEPSGIAGLALLFQLQAEGNVPIPENAKVLIVNTGKTKYHI